ncbi:hypothetical protein E2562_025207 [Oryza meyeriana var. granulata]|uniref:Uncharacterized protein n=1 Tax=Oryza meyeriana var. granulata TaxID=110450 RepID=A0A6G1E1G5_9ORYZ|nr:hypothetical protein E2562_025207 [Oryza meyeriana var. granulata]
MSWTAPTVLKKRRLLSSSTSVRCSSWLRMSTIDRFRVILRRRRSSSPFSRCRGRPACPPRPSSAAGPNLLEEEHCCCCCCCRLLADLGELVVSSSSLTLTLLGG